jgi:hypothetical protein
MAANETPHAMKLAWTPGPGFGQGGDGVNVAVGRKGTYQWVYRDGLHPAYHYPHGSKTPVVLPAPQDSWKRAYQAGVEHNTPGIV